ncbi:Phosphate transport regulator (distant homolog of PhoU) [hydrothermal vent metagenome]|uniref:Phosphate transport regulator (Distant homolog of PhoU) n=1 Tax=hydrothermal vent metagenome TaxID=652676 RepID=A0A3B0YVV9_9ZZZZ
MAGGGYMSGIFGSSPVKPMQQHMAKVLACVSKLMPLFENIIKEDWDQVAKVQKQISGLEKEADVMKKQLRLHLPKGLFMPVSRRDLLEVLTMQDTIANRAKDIAGVILGRQMVLPKIIHDDYLKYVERCVDACEQASLAINELDELVGTGFSGQEVKLVVKMISKLDSIESDTDNLQADIRHKIFAVEKEFDPIDVMFLYKIIDWTGDVADRAQRVGSRLQLMLAR